MQCKDTSAARDDVMIRVWLRLRLLIVVVVLYDKGYLWMDPKFSEAIFLVPCNKVKWKVSTRIIQDLINFDV